MNTPQHLSVIPLHDWPPEALMRESKRAAMFWRNDPAFREKYGHIQSGGLYVDKDERAAEIMFRVLERLKKEPPKPHIDQTTFFHQVARYCKPGIANANRGRLSVTEGADGDEGDANDSGESEIDGPFFDVTGDADKDAERAEVIQELFKKIGVGEKDFVLFDTTVADWIESTGLSERQLRNEKESRKKEIEKKINSLSGAQSRILKKSAARPRHAVANIFYCIYNDGQIAAAEPKSASRPGGLRFHLIAAGDNGLEFETRGWEPGDNWIYKCRVFSASAKTADVMNAFTASPQD